MGAGRPLSRRNTKELKSVSIPSQEEARRRRKRRSTKKFLAQMAFALAITHPGCHIPEGSPLAPRPPLFQRGGHSFVLDPQFWTRPAWV